MSQCRDARHRGVGFARPTTNPPAQFALSIYRSASASGFGSSAGSSSRSRRSLANLNSLLPRGFASSATEEQQSPAPCKRTPCFEATITLTRHGQI